MKVLFLDDCPNRQKAFRSNVPHARIVATAAELIAEIQKEVPDVLFLDHDLGGEVYVDSGREDCGMEVVRWMEKNAPTIPHVIVHTMNPYAGTEMRERLQTAGYQTIHAPFGTGSFKQVALQV